MKNIIFTTAIAVLILTGLVSFRSSTNNNAYSNKHSLQQAADFPVPDDVKAILDKSCLPCHGADGTVKGKMKWNYDKMSEMKTSKVISKLSKIITKVEDGKMPTKKFVKKYPEKALTEADKKALTDWADGLAESLTK
jgi:cytochrome c553